MAKIEHSFHEITALIDSFPPDERLRLGQAFLEHQEEGMLKWWDTIREAMTPEHFADVILPLLAQTGLNFSFEMFSSIRNMRKDIEGRVKDHFTVKPRNTKRDAEIVRLHDEQGLSFGEIRRHLATNDPNSMGPLSRDAVRKAYHRAKDRDK